MANIPTATVTIDAQAGALAGGTGYCVVISCVERNADLTPRVFSSFKGILAQHGYSQGAAYAALHIDATKKPVIFIGVPTATAGAVGRINASGVTGTSVITVTPGSAGYLEETDATFTVTNGGTIGTRGITGTLTLDGGLTTKTIRLETATTYTVPYVGIVLNFGAGTLVTGDVYKFATTAPMWDSAGISSAKDALVAQQKTGRSWVVIGDLQTHTQAGYVTTAANAYETSNERFTLARVNVRDRLPLAQMSQATVVMTGNPNITFAEVGVTGDTITRSAGSFITDGFLAGQVVTVAGAVAGSGHNNVTGKITGVTATVLTLDTADVDNEGPISGVSIIGSAGLIFTTTTCTRSNGSWFDDGFRVGSVATFTGTASNNITVTITALTATVMTFASGGTAETVASRSVTCIAGETMAAWVSANDTEFATVDAQKRIDIGIGRLRKQCPITLWQFRRPVMWAASVREYQHDVHITTWRKEFGPLDGWSMLDANNVKTEYDERTDGGALAARFTCARTWANGPIGSFIAMSLTRDTEGSPLAFTHNMYVANVTCSIVQAATENFIGKTPQVDTAGKLLPSERSKLESTVNTDLEIALLQEHVSGEGPRASKAVWTASADDVITGTNATVNGVTELHVNGTIVNVITVVKVS